MNGFDSLVLLQATGAAAPQGSFMMSFAPLLFMILIFYFLLIRPQQKKQRLHQKMLSEIKKGDRVLTTGGIFGLVENVKDNGVLVIKVADNVKLEFARSAVATVLKGSSEISAAANKPSEIKSNS